MTHQNETLEEASIRFNPIKIRSSAFGSKYEWTPSKERKQFINGAEWQKSKMYSEEDVVSILEFVRQNYYDIGLKWHKEPDTDLTSEEIIEQYKLQK